MRPGTFLFLTLINSIFPPSETRSNHSAGIDAFVENSPRALHRLGNQQAKPFVPTAAVYRFAVAFR
jgi:hypothetical protein